MYGHDLFKCSKCGSEIIHSYIKQDEYRIYTNCNCNKKKLRNIDEVIKKLKEENEKINKNTKRNKSSKKSI